MHLHDYVLQIRSTCDIKLDGIIHRLLLQTCTRSVSKQQAKEKHTGHIQHNSLELANYPDAFKQDTLVRSCRGMGATWENVSEKAILQKSKILCIVTMRSHMAKRRFQLDKSVHISQSDVMMHKEIMQVSIVTILTKFHHLCSI